MKKLSYILMIFAIVLSNIGSAVVAYNYKDALCAIEHEGFSAPASIAFLCAIPFVVGIAISVILSIVFYKKSK